MAKEETKKGASRKVEVFRSGTFRAMNGQDYSFSDADVAAMAASYDAAKAPAPVVVGHPTHDAPAFGWAAGFAVNDAGTLVAELGELDPAFVSAVEEGRYRKVSMKFFPPDAPNNPAPGSYYPRHIGFLGGAAPAVSGLAPVQFADGEAKELIEFEVSFAEPAMQDVATLFRKLREFIIEKFSREEADEAVPNYLIRWVDDAANEPASDGPGFTQPQKKDTSMPDDTKLAARAAELDKREHALANKENLAFTDGLIEEGKLLPAQKSRVVALMNALSVGDQADFSFSDDGTDKTASPVQMFKDILSAGAKGVAFGAQDMGDDPAKAKGPAFASDGMAVDPDGLATHNKARAYQSKNPGTDYLTAVQAVTEA